MAKACKPIDIATTNISKAEKAKRKAAEEKLAGNNDSVYNPPKHLSKEEKDLYLFLVSELKASNILNNLDTFLLEQTVNAIARMREADKLIKKHGQLIEKQDGSLQKNPAIAIYKEFQGIYYQCCLQLGLSPSSRSKLALINVQAKENEQDELLKALAGD